MIEVKNLSFSYGKGRILSDISAKFEKGYFYAIIGANGSGKTTLINNLSRIVKPTSGEIFIDGTDYKDISRKEFAKKVSLLPQGRNVPNMSAFDLVSAGRYPYLDLSRNLSDEDVKIVNISMQMTDTEKFADKNLKRLSGGERQRVYLAMLAAQNTDYILLDEPITHLDMASEYKTLNLLADMSSKGKCVIAVLHNLPLALEYADEICVVDKGKIVKTGTPKEIAGSNVFEEFFGIQCKTINTDGKDRYIFQEKP